MDMDLLSAIEIVLSLARENMMTETDASENGMLNDRNEAFDACGVLEDFASNNLVD